jgi:hypothetical protein
VLLITSEIREIKRKIRNISVGYHRGGCGEFYVLGYNAVQSVESQLAFPVGSASYLLQAETLT